MRKDKGRPTQAHPGADQQLDDEQPREAALIAVLTTIIERVCVVEQPRAMVQSDLPRGATKAA